MCCSKSSSFANEAKRFARQHTGCEYLGQVEEDLQTAVLEAIPAEKRVRGLSPEERLRGLSEEELARLRDLLERRQSH